MAGKIRSGSILLKQSYYITKFRALTKDVRSAITGTEEDFTKGSINRAVLLLSIPMVLEMIMESVFAIVDIYFVSKIGHEAVATVGITESLTTIIYAFSVGLSVAATAVVSRRVGEKRIKAASHAAFQAIITGAFASLFIAVPGLIYAEEILVLMGLTPEVAAEYYSYTAWILGGNIVIFLLFSINAVFRGAGDAALSLRVLWFANGLNIILDPILIFGWGPFPELGIEGAAIATNTGRGAAVLYQLYILFFGSGRIKLKVKELRIDFKEIIKLVKISLGSIGQFVIATTSWIIMIRIAAVFGSTVVAGYTIGIRILIFALLPAMGIANAAATLTGQNLGAGKPDRAERSVWVTSKYMTAYMVFISILFIFFRSQLVGLFIDNPEVIDVGAELMLILGFGFISYGLGMILVNSINGAGDTVTPTKINLVCFWLMEIPLAYLLAIEFKFDETGVFLSIVISETIMTLLAFLAFRHGKWKTKVV
jgi:putative MATE family efflux protein